jgi:para-nitrobenzyl esterase
VRPQVSLIHGLAEGTEDGGVFRFLGMPYAAPPVGDRRWRAPVAPDRWEGVRDASWFGPVCPQTRFASFDLRVREQSEDCLYLNVWTRTMDHEAHQPVMVWIHGGGHLGGAGSEDAFDGAHLAGRGVTVVTINYRLAAFGYLSHPDIDGNIGVLDQIAALEWVAQNIEAFGGDPGNITVFGESAGATSVRALLSARRARGLFHRAILQSAGFESAASQPTAPGPGRTAAATAELFARLGGDVASARTAPTAKVLELSVELSGTRPPAGQVHTPANLVWTPAYDDRELSSGSDFPGWPTEVPVMLGCVENEARYFLQPSGTYLPAVLDAMVAVLAGHRAADVAALFAGSDTTTYEALDQLFTTAIFTEPAFATLKRFAALDRELYYYVFGRVSPGNLRSGHLAKHTAEIRYLFGNLAPAEDYDETDAELADAMQDAWIAFARDGVPVLPDGTAWPRFDNDRKRMTVITDTLREVPFTTSALTNIIHTLRS